jgi:glucosylceramidase
MPTIPRNVWIAILLFTCLATAACPSGCSKVAQVLNPTSVQSVTVTPLAAQLTVGQTQQFTATVLPSGVSDRSVTWSVAPAALATIDANGVLSALAPGQAIVTATSTATPVHTAQAAANITAAQ